MKYRFSAFFYNMIIYHKLSDSLGSKTNLPTTLKKFFKELFNFDKMDV